MTIKNIITFSICFSFIFSCKENSIALKETSNIPTKIKIILASGISVREDDPEKAIGKGKQIGTAHKDYSYDVLDAHPWRYKIKLPTGEAGWISANPSKKWTIILKPNTVKINHPDALAVLNSPEADSKSIGIAPKGYEYEVLDSLYSYYKIALPDGKTGWVYKGKKDEPWLEEIR